MWVLAEFLHKRTSQLHSGRSTERAKVRNLKGGARTSTHSHIHTHRHFWFTVRVCLSKRITVKLIGIIFQDILVQAVNDRNKYNLPNRKARRKWAVVWKQRMNTHTKRHPRPQSLHTFFIFYFTDFGPTLGVLTSSTVKFCSRAHAVWGKVKASEEAWGTAGERSRRTPCGSRPTWAEPLVDCREGGKRGRVFDITSKKSVWFRANTEQNPW